MEDVMTMRSGLTREGLLGYPYRLEVIRAGTHPAVTETQKSYLESRVNLFSPDTQLTNEVVGRVLEKREAELKEAINNNALKGAADRGGYTLGSLLELNSLALRELKGELNAKTVLIRTLEMLTDEEEQRVTLNAKEMTREGLSIDLKSGAIINKVFLTDGDRKWASEKAQKIKANFIKGKDQMLQFIVDLK